MAPRRIARALRLPQCFIRSGEDLTPKLAHIDKVQDKRVYGLFPEFREKLREDIIVDYATRLREMDAATVDAMIATVPVEWEVSKEARKAWNELIYRRAGFVADYVHVWSKKARLGSARRESEKWPEVFTVWCSPAPIGFEPKR